MERDGTGESASRRQPVDEERLRAQAARAYDNAVRESLREAQTLAGRTPLRHGAQALARVAVQIRDLTNDVLTCYHQEAVAAAGREWGTGDAHAVFARVADAAWEAFERQYTKCLQEAVESSTQGRPPPRTDVLAELSLRVHGYLGEVVEAYGRYLIAVAPTPHPYARRFPAIGLDTQGRSQKVTARTGTAFVSGHGVDPGTDDVRVPRGRSVSFYADTDTSTLASVTQAVLTAGDILPRQTYHAGQDMPNYQLGSLQDDEMAAEVASVSDRLPGKLYVVGADWPLGDSPLRLCTAPEVCAKPDPAVGYDPDLSTRHHPGCTGVFNRLAEADLHLLICRQSPDAPRVDTTAMDVRQVIDQGRPVDTTPYGDQPDAHTRSVRDQVAAIFTWAAIDLAAAVTYVHSLPQATLATLRSRPGFVLWLECAQHTPDHRQAEAVAELLVTSEDFPGWARRWWRALPQATREILWTKPAVRRCLRHLGEPVGNPRRPRTPAPAEFSDAWHDIHWRNAFTTWLTTTTPTPPQQPLLTLYALLHPITHIQPTTNNDTITMTTGTAFGDLATLTDTDILPTAEHILTHSRNHGHIPALAQPHLLDTLETDLHHFDPDIATEAGLDNTGTANPILIRQDLQHLNTSLTHQLNTHYQTYRQTIERHTGSTP